VGGAEEAMVLVLWSERRGGQRGRGGGGQQELTSGGRVGRGGRRRGGGVWCLGGRNVQSDKHPRHTDPCPQERAERRERSQQTEQRVREREGSYLSVTLTPFAAAASVIDAHLDFEAAR
jgi:hypothetical protein